MGVTFLVVFDGLHTLAHFLQVPREQEMGGFQANACVLIAQVERVLPPINKDVNKL
jgi:hypothetical protein